MARINKNAVDAVMAVFDDAFTKELGEDRTRILKTLAKAALGSNDTKIIASIIMLLVPTLTLTELASVRAIVNDEDITVACLNNNE